MYLNRKAFGRAAGASKTQLIIGIIGAAIFGVALAFSITGYETSEGNMRQFALMYLILLLPFVFLILRSLQTRQAMGRAREFNAVFQGDQDGIVPLSQLSRHMGKTETQLEKELEGLFRRGFLINCALEGDRVILQGIEDKKRGDFITVVCAACGGSTTLRSGAYGSCQYCGSKIQGKG